MRAALTKRTPHPSIIRNTNKFFAWRILMGPAATVHSEGEAPLAADPMLAPIWTPA
jgi:hypothetical protein